MELRKIETKGKRKRRKKEKSESKANRKESRRFNKNIRFDVQNQ